MKTGIELIAEERNRQIKDLKWTPDNDDQYTKGELPLAAACYAINHTNQFSVRNGYRVNADWPWDAKWWKPTPENRIKELQKAGALIAAEIDRLQRKNS